MTRFTYWGSVVEIEYTMQVLNTDADSTKWDSATENESIKLRLDPWNHMEELG